MVLLLLVLLLFQQHDAMELPISTATAKTIYSASKSPDNAIDSDTSTIYHSEDDGQPQWLKLTLAYKSVVEELVIVNR